LFILLELIFIVCISTNTFVFVFDTFVPKVLALHQEIGNTIQYNTVQ